MSTLRYKTLVQKLRNGTEIGTVNWKKAGTVMGGADLYQTDLGSYNVKFFYRQSEAGAGDVDYVIVLMRGDEALDEFTDLDLQKHFEKSYAWMADFYREVAHQVKG